MGKKLKNITDTNLLLTITIVVFFVMYIGAIVFQGKGFLKPQTFFNILNANAALIILSCGMSLVMITGENTHIAHFGGAAAGFAFVLHNEKYTFLYNRRLRVLKDHPFRRVVPQLLFALVGLLAGFEVYGMP